MATATAQPMYCKGCGYNLIGLEEWRCPECGRFFSPESPSTYSDGTATPARQIAGRMLMVGGAFFFAAPIALAYFSDVLILDPVLLAFVFLGKGVAAGNRKAAWWALGLLCLEALVGVAIASAAKQLSWQAWWIERHQIAPALGLMVTAWALTTAWLVYRSLQQNEPTPRMRWRIVFPIAAAALILVLALVPYLIIQERQRQRKAPYRSVVIELLDQHSGERIPPMISGPGRGEHDVWEWGVEMQPDLMTVRWKAADPLAITASSNGYENKAITLDSQTPGNMTIRLKKNAATHILTQPARSNR